MSDIFVPATITDLTVVDPNEIRNVELTLPREHEIAGTIYPIIDEMRPGTAFLAKPFGTRTGRQRRRMYTRSNSSIDCKGVLQTIINDTHAEKADTSVWWQTDQAETFRFAGETIPILMNMTQDGTALVPYENCGTIEDSNLRLEPDEDWPAMRCVGIAFSTGITPFLAHLRYMKALSFGRTNDRGGVHYTLVVSVKNPRQLMAHDELRRLEKEFPENVVYYPVLTREWPEDWTGGKGRIMRVVEPQSGKQGIDIGPLRELGLDLKYTHVRLCGNKDACRQLTEGLAQAAIRPLTFRAEAW